MKAINMKEQLDKSTADELKKNMKVMNKLNSRMRKFNKYAKW